jgi:hypothetical protein
MAAKEIYDYVDTIASDVNYTLTLDPQSVITELGTKNDVVHFGDDGNDEVIGMGGSSVIPFIIIRYELLNESDAGQISQFWYDSNRGDGMLNSFKFSHPDGHTYVVRFDNNFERVIDPINYGVRNIKLKILGRIAD